MASFYSIDDELRCGHRALGHRWKVGGVEAIAVGVEDGRWRCGGGLAAGDGFGVSCKSSGDRRGCSRLLALCLGLAIGRRRSSKARVKARRRATGAVMSGLRHGFLWRWRLELAGDGRRGGKEGAEAWQSSH
ncbi:hypothetical protein ACJRO7_001224 [Eucalyptus globulus]|uniref:Uncharacterized protein n=1 Tax=Eucalyptus globulus TaxID=34317 RepID=A0ABD3LTU3_EUCGL